MTHLINHTFIQTEFGIAISPDHSGKVSLLSEWYIYNMNGLL